jgi:bilirubin oxidase
MKKKLLTLIATIIFYYCNAQNLIPIPPIVTGTNIDLMLQNGTTQFYAGFNTATNGYNGNYLGPTIILQKGQNVNMNVMNMLNEVTTTHWHGLHVAPMNDGSPHNPIAIGATWSPSFTVMDNAATYWYHPHLHGSTMKQVIKGAAGFIIVNDDVESALTLPRNYGVDDFPIAFQFETFNNTTKQIVIDDELDNAVLVNGIVSNASINVPAQVVRLRLLNASSHRFFNFGFSDNRSFSQITSDDGLLDSSVSMTRFILSPGERAEILVNFTTQQGSSVYLMQYGTQLPAGYPGGPQDAMGMMVLGPLDNTNFNLLQFNIQAPTTNSITTIPTALTTNTVLSEVGSTSRTIAITGSPAMSMTNFLMNGVQYNENVINFSTQQDNVEVWNITNQSMMPHPFHIHGNHFYVLKVNGATPPLNMQGRKDVITVPPNGGSVKLITQYKDFNDATMPFMYHCHILSHEDTGMMGQFIVNPNPLSINEVSMNDGIKIYPNPINNTQFLNIQSETNIQSIEFFDILGRSVLTKELDNKIETIAVPNLSGVYMIKIKTENKTITQKIIIN